MDKLLLQEMELYINRNRSDNDIKDKDHFHWLDTCPEPEEQIYLSDFYVARKKSVREKPRLLPGEMTDTSKNNIPEHHIKNKDRICRKFKTTIKRMVLSKCGIPQEIPETLYRLNKERNIQTIEYKSEILI